MKKFSNLLFMKKIIYFLLIAVIPGGINAQSLSADLLQRYHTLLPNAEPDPELRQVSRIGQLYKVTDKYAGGKLASIKYAREIPLTASFPETGATTEFYPDGKLRRSRNPEGEAFRVKEYFSSGEPYREYLEKGEATEMVTVWDVEGSASVKEGNGRAVEMFRFDDEVVLETGVYENGRRTGEWQGDAGRPYFTEVYKAGRLISGESWDKNGAKFPYKAKSERVEFKGGEQKLYSFLAKNITLPRGMPDGSVRVDTQFIVDEKGEVGSLQILNEAFPEAIQEAIRVVKATSGKWMPGKHRGQAVKMEYRIPIVFTVK